MAALKTEQIWQKYSVASQDSTFFFAFHHFGTIIQFKRKTLSFKNRLGSIYSMYSHHSIDRVQQGISNRNIKPLYILTLQLFIPVRHNTE